MAKPLTEAQRVNLAAIKAAGGTVEHDRYGFHKPGERECLRGMNAVAVNSLVKSGRLVLMKGTDRDTISIAPPSPMTDSQRAALAWARERFRGNKP